MGYQLLDHTADIGVHVWATTVKDLFQEACTAMFDIITDTDRSAAVGNHRQNICVSGQDLPDLMINWLSELLYLWTGENKLVRSVDVVRFDKLEIEALVMFDVYDPEQHTIENEIKAVTYHQIQVISTPQGWEAKIIFDV